MSTSTDKRDVHGRSWDQATKNGSSSAGSMGAGGTGDSGRPAQGQGQQSDSSTAATRTDDVLSDGSDQDASGEAFHSSGGKVQTGLEGIGSMSGGGAGNRQATGQPGAQNQQGDRKESESGKRTTGAGRDEGKPSREDGQDR